MWETNDNLSIVLSIIDLRDFRVIIILNREISLMLDLESYQDTCIAYFLEIHYPGNGAIMLRRFDSYNEPAYRCRGYARSKDRIFGCDTVSSICFNSRDASLVDAMKVPDALLVQARQGHKVGDNFVSKTKE